MDTVMTLCETCWHPSMFSPAFILVGEVTCTQMRFGMFEQVMTVLRTGLLIETWPSNRGVGGYLISFIGICWCQNV